jgi:hypothetical protein
VNGEITGIWIRFRLDAELTGQIAHGLFWTVSICIAVDPLRFTASRESTDQADTSSERDAFTHDPPPR